MTCRKKETIKSKYHIVRHIRDTAADKHWDRYVMSSSYGSLYHTSTWRNVIESAFGKKSICFRAENESGEIVGVLPLVMFSNRLFSRRLVSMPYANYGGILANKTTIAKSLEQIAIETAQRECVGYLELREAFRISSSSNFAVHGDKTIMRLTLPDSIDIVGQRIGSKRRSQVRRPLKSGATIATGGRELLPQFYDLFCTNMRDLGTPVYPMKFFESFFSHYEEGIRLIVIFIDGEPAAAGLLVHWKRSLEIPWAASNRNYNKLGVNMLLYWEAIKLAIDEGCQTFDFGRSSIDSGTYRFKSQWGAVPTHCNWIVWPSSAAKSMQGALRKYGSRVWKRVPLSIANRVGPIIAPNLPW